MRKNIFWFSQWCCWQCVCPKHNNSTYFFNIITYTSQNIWGL